MNTIDMRTRPCPIPVIEAKKELARPGAAGVTVLVDNEIAVQNLQKMAVGLGHGFDARPGAAGDFSVRITKAGHPESFEAAPARMPDAAPSSASHAGGAVVLISAQTLGRGDNALGAMLMKGFLYSLAELPAPPAALLFLNGGVRLVCEGGGSLSDLAALAERGTEIRACGACLNYYGLTDQVAVGAITDMGDIAGRLAAAPRVITL